MQTDRTNVRTRILRYLAQGRTLTPLTALRKFGCLSLSQRIGELKRREHWPIETEMVKVGTKVVAQYSLPKARRA